jgi:hypothetical protein
MENRSHSGNVFFFFIGCIVVVLIILIVLSFPWEESCGGFEVYLINESQVSNGTVIHLTDMDFREFPKMATIIRDGHYTTEICTSSKEDSSNCVGKGRIVCNQEQQFGKYQTQSYNVSSQSYQNERYLEYNGRFFFMKRSYYV